MPSESPHPSLIDVNRQWAFERSTGASSNSPRGALAVSDSMQRPGAPAADTASLSDDELSAFRTASAVWRREPPRVWAGLRRAALARTGEHCWLCSAPATRVDHLIAPRAGGPTRLENLIGACVHCSSSRLDLDPLEYAETNGLVLTRVQRIERDFALSVSLQHPVPSASQRSNEACYRYLSDSRWRHPRIPMAVAPVADGWLCSPLAARTGRYAGALIHAIRQAGGTLVSDGLVRVPKEIIDAVAVLLIERHAIIRVVPGNSTVGGAVDADQHVAWCTLLDGIEDTRRGRPRKPLRGFGRRAAVRTTELPSV